MREAIAASLPERAPPHPAETQALSFDVEDWRHIVHWKLTGEQIRPDPAVVGETESILGLLDRRGARATFFVLANVARSYPDLVRRIAAAGHEVGSHGWSHRLVYRQTPEEFREETARAKALLEEVTGEPVLGYRAAEFSIIRQSWWALEILGELGFSYDSSVYPIRGRRYGVPDSPVSPFWVEHAGGRLLEIPMTAVECWGRRWPVAGGGYFRFFPYAWTCSAIRRVNAEGRGAVVYLHPYEFATARLRVATRGEGWRGRLRKLRYTAVHNFAPDRVRANFTALLADFRFQPLRKVFLNFDAE